MAATITNKYGSGDGTFIADIDSTNVTNPHTVKPIVRVQINKVAYDALSAAAKAEIDAVTIANVIATAFS